MSRMTLGFAAIAALVFTPDVAFAEQPYYFHKAGIGREAYMVDVNDCAQLSGQARTTHYTVRALNPNAPYALESAAIAGFFIGFLERRERRRMLSRIERTCMADKGYRRRSIDKETGSAIRKLEGDARVERLFALVSSPAPVGEVLVE